MTKNEIMSLLDSNSPLDYPVLTPLASFVSLCASFEADLIHSLGTLTLIDIDHVSIMKSSVMKPHTKNMLMLAYMGVEPRQIPTLAV